jgi:hypothetical protein
MLNQRAFSALLKIKHTSEGHDDVPSGLTTASASVTEHNFLDSHYME